MQLPIFLRPLLLIGHYYRLLTQGFTAWIQRSTEERFGPLEQMIVAVVIISLAMNPELLPQFNPQYQAPGYQAYPVHVPVPVPVPYSNHQASPPPPSVPRPIAPPSTWSGLNITSTTGSDSGSGWLNSVPANIRPGPVTLALVILLISVGIHCIPHHLLARLKESWRVFWPPWQDRSQPVPAATTATSGSRSSTRASEPSSDRNAKSSSADPVEKPSSRSTDIKTSSRTPDVIKAEASTTAAAGSSSRTRSFEEEKARQKEKALLEYEAKEAAKAKATLAEDEKKVISDVKATVADGLDASGKTQSEKARSVKSDAPAIVAVAPGTNANTSTSTEKPKDLPSADKGTPDSAEASTRGTTAEEDPLMAGDYRPLKSILKKSTKKPRQSKNIHHNYFMGMRGHRAHLIPFPHGLHPPPAEARHTLWWRNIPKDASHMMAPPPVPKEVKDVLRGEDIEEPTKVEADKGGPSSKDGEKARVSSSEKDGDKEKEQEKEKEKARAKAEAEAKEKERERAKMKLKEASTSREPETATAKASIEPPSEPDVSIDPRVKLHGPVKPCSVSYSFTASLNSSRYSSASYLAHRLVHQQLGLILLVFFVWQQLNAARQTAAKPRSPVAAATATAVAPPTPRAPPPAVALGAAVQVPKSDKDMPPEMLEKLARAKAAKKQAEEEASRPRGGDKGTAKNAEVVTAAVDKGKRKSDSGSSSRDEDRRPKEPESLAPKVDKGKQRAVPEATEGDDDLTAKTRSAEKTTSAEKAISAGKSLPRALTADERAAYRARKAAQSQSPDPDPEQKTPKSDKSGVDGTDAKRAAWDKMSDEEKKQYLADREQRRASPPQPRADDQTPEGKKKERLDKMSDAEKKQYLAEKENRRTSPSRSQKQTLDAKKREQWAKLTDEEKKQYLAEREKRKRAAETPDPTVAAQAKREKWEKMSDDEKQRYLNEWKKRELAKSKLGEGSGLTAGEKEKL